MSEARNQHFISQVEQRLNAINPNALPRNQRIYKLRVVDREDRRLMLANENGSPIKANLSLSNLFSFDVDLDGRLRENFESLFNDYEASIPIHTEGILRKLAVNSNDLKTEVIDLFAAKLIGFIRNPYSVVKVLNTFPELAQHHPTDLAVSALYLRILAGRRPHQAYLCGKLGITDQQYEAWLRIIFMLLTPLRANYPPFFAGVIKGVFELEDAIPFVTVYKYDDQCCLLSDRGFSHPIDQEPNLVFDFNLCSNAFIRYAFLNHVSVFGRQLPEAIARGLKLGPKLVMVQYRPNDLFALDVFHRRAVEQCFESVYCSSKTPYRVTVMPPTPVAPAQSQD